MIFPHPDDIVIWPDNTWCYRNELHEMSYMSDDYVTVSVDSPEYAGTIEGLEGSQ